MKRARLVAAGPLGAVGLPLLWGMAIEPYLLEWRDEVAEVPRLPAAWEGRELVLLADLQVGIWLANTRAIRTIVRRLVARRPSLVVIAGDFVSELSRDAEAQIATATDLVRPLPAAGIRAYAVLGNHDYLVSADGAEMYSKRAASRVGAALEAAGVRVLHNEAVALQEPGDGRHRSAGVGGEITLYLVGIGAHLPGDDRPMSAVSQVPEGAPRLVLMHNPDSFRALPAGSAPVAMAGHTHGGQIRVPFKPSWSGWSWAKGRELDADGWVRGYGAPGNHLYVSRGIGFSGVPIRFGCRPEVTTFTLRASQRIR
jgi:predicted MPP superfamily phosphohydrolase